MIRIWLMTLIILFMSSQTWAQDMGNWSDKTVCRVIATAEDNSIYLAEAKRRKLDCSNFKPNPSGYGNKAESTVPTKPISTEPGIQIYAVALKPAVKAVPGCAGHNGIDRVWNRSVGCSASM
ncbi:MAG: hypothetical protein ACPHYA_06145 [Pseudomonadales bacterium]